MKHNFHTPLLRWVALLYNYCGVPMHRPLLSNPVNIAFNLTLFVVLFYSLLSVDPFELASFGESDREGQAPKPLLVFLIRLYRDALYPSVAFVALSYMFFAGRPILTRLDRLSRFYQPPNQKRTFCLLLLLNHSIVAFYLAFKFHRSDRSSNQSVMEIGLSTFTNYVITVAYDHHFLYAMHYQQHVTLCAVRGLYLSPAFPKNFSESIQTLARLNRELNQLLSIPLITFITLSVFNGVLSATFIVLCGMSPLIIGQALFTMAYLSYLIELNRRVLVALERACNPIGYWSKRKQYYSSRQLFFPFDSRRQSMSPPPPPPLALLGLCLTHRGHFRVRIFRLITMDQVVLGQVVLFMLNYFVLITQTN